MKRECLECGKEFEAPECWVRRGEGKYCSRHCGFISRESRALRAVAKMSELNPNWKGENAKYHAIHRWVERRLKKPLVCPFCGEKGWLDLHNRSGEYKRDITDWEWRCRRCHMQIDGRLERRIGGRYAQNKAAQEAT